MLFGGAFGKQMPTASFGLGVDVTRLVVIGGSCGRYWGDPQRDRRLPNCCSLRRASGVAARAASVPRSGCSTRPILRHLNRRGERM